MYICTFHILLKTLFETLRTPADRNAQPGIRIRHNSNLIHMYMCTFHICLQTLFQSLRILVHIPGVRIYILPELEMSQLWTSPQIVSAWLGAFHIPGVRIYIWPELQMSRYFAQRQKSEPEIARKPGGKQKPVSGRFAKKNWAHRDRFTIRPA